MTTISVELLMLLPKDVNHNHNNNNNNKNSPSLLLAWPLGPSQG